MTVPVSRYSSNTLRLNPYTPQEAYRPQFPGRGMAIGSRGPTAGSVVGSGRTTGLVADGIAGRVAVVGAGAVGKMGAATGCAPGGGLVVGIVMVWPAIILSLVSPLTSVMRCTEVR